MMSLRALATIFCCAAVEAGCGQWAQRAADENATLVAELSRIPDGVQCLRITSEGERLVRQQFAVTPGQAGIQLKLTLPVGPQTIMGEAFDETCPDSGTPSGRPTWQSDGFPVRLTATTVTRLKLLMHRPENTHIEIDFVEEGPAGGVGCGTTHTCAVLQDGSVSCWGQNSVWQLGSNTLPDAVVERPIAVPPLPSLARGVAVGRWHSCAVLDDGTVSCWGFGEAGQLGFPVADFGGPGTVDNLFDTRAIAVGSEHSCALGADAQVRCWGSNQFGQLGDGTVLGPMFPYGRGSAELVHNLEPACAIAAGRGHSCALLCDGRVKCWGANDRGQLGDGTTQNRSLPVVVGGLLDVARIAAGAAHTCAVTKSGAVSCWGNNDHGQLGDGSSLSRSIPGPVSLSQAAVSLRAGGDQTCAVLPSGNGSCWGANGSGQLGTGNTADQHVPAVAAEFGKVLVLAPGDGYTCALSRTGAVYCAGANQSGQLGDGTTTSRTTPVSVAF